jgi:hypothetical protein
MYVFHHHGFVHQILHAIFSPDFRLQISKVRVLCGGLSLAVCRLSGERVLTRWSSGRWESNI